MSLPAAEHDDDSHASLSTVLIYVFVAVAALHQLEATLWISLAILLNVAAIWGVIWWRNRDKKKAVTE